MAFSSTTQVDNLRQDNYFQTLFKGTAGASGNTIVVPFIVDFIVGYPNLTFTQSGGTVTTAGITNTHVVNLSLLGSRSL